MYIDHSHDNASQAGPYKAASQQPISLAKIKEISLQRLQMNDMIESQNLLIACMEDGVFYLNLHDYTNQDGSLLSLSKEIFSVSQQLFDLPLEEKMSYDIDKNGIMRVNGYKPLGRNKGGLAGGKDGFESYAIAKDFITSPTSSVRHRQTPHPAEIASQLPLLQSFADKVTAASCTILSCLSAVLDFAPGTGFEAHHRPGAPSPSMLRLLKYTEQPLSERGAPQNPHTDLGSLTLLFTRSPGLQRKNMNPRTTVRPPAARGHLQEYHDHGHDHDKDGESSSSSSSSSAWEFVEPRAHCAIVNVGDVLSALSGGVLHSCLHRVVPLPGKKMGERFSFAWMSRPESDTLMRGLQGGGGKVLEGCQDGAEVITSDEWLRRKFTVLRK